MPFALDLMDHDPLIVSPDLPVPRLARLLLEARVDGACVVEHGLVIGVVTTMDLISQEKRVQIPTYVNLLNRLLPIGQAKKQADLDKVTGRLVRDIMSDEPLGVAFDASLEDIAGLMVDEHITIVPVLREGRLVGVISKPDVVRAALANMGDADGG